MPKISNIEKRGLTEVVAKLALQNSEREIVQILGRDHSFKTTQAAVHRFVSGLRAERSEQVRAKVNEAVVGRITSDVEELDHIASDVLKGIYDDVEMQPSIRIQAADKARAIFESKMKFSGAGSGGDGESEIVVYVPDDGRNPQ
jgi:hypothetical protein